MYNCRSANTWEDDLALTVTHFPRNRLTFGILFGCTAAIERKILNRISTAKDHAAYPLFLPGIFAELERERMKEVVETTIDEIEGAIYELDAGPGSGTRHFGRDRRARRTVWLNTTFLRSKLHIWKTQLAKMIDHIDELSRDRVIFSGRDPTSVARDGALNCSDADDSTALLLHRTERLTRSRLRDMIEEFDELIENCSMGVEGMAMATQWVGPAKSARCTSSSMSPHFSFT